MYRKINIKKILIGCIAIIALPYLLSYEYVNEKLRNLEVIKKKDVLKNIQQKITLNMRFPNSSKILCDYSHLSHEEMGLPTDFAHLYPIKMYQSEEDGGDCYPRSCTPTISTAIIALYSYDTEVVHTFLQYIHLFLREQKIHYRIYMVDETSTTDLEPLYKTTLYNIGALTAMKDGFPCLIFHDIDLLPKIPAHLYACTKNPRVMTSEVISSYSKRKTSSAVAITSKLFMMINGMCNKYDAWMEHLYDRLEYYGNEMCQFEDDLNKFHSLTISVAEEWKTRSAPRMLEEEMISDGLMTLQNVEIHTYKHTLSTQIVIQQYADVLNHMNLTLREFAEDY